MITVKPQEQNSKSLDGTQVNIFLCKKQFTFTAHSLHIFLVTEIVSTGGKQEKCDSEYCDL